MSVNFINFKSHKASPHKVLSNQNNVRMRTFYFILLGFFLLPYASSSSQTNTHFTNPLILDILKGNYDPEIYIPPFPVDDPASISQGLVSLVEPDSMKATLVYMQRFHNRNTASDTISADTGIGAARSWILERFNKISEENNSRLVTGYLYFD